MLRDEINNSLKDAMKGGDARRVSTLRLVNSTLKNADIEARGQGKPALTDDDVLGVLQKMIKQRHESAELYEKGGRADLVTQEREEIAIIEKYLPKQLTDQEIHDTIVALVKETGASAMKDMGRGQARLRQSERRSEEDIERGVAISRASRRGLRSCRQQPRCCPSISVRRPR